MAEQEWTTEVLAARPRRRFLTPITMALLAAAVGVGGFLIGVAVEKGQVPSGGATAGGAGLRALLGGAGGGRGAGAGGLGAALGGGGGARASGGGGSGTGGSVATGQVQSVSGNTLYVTDNQGSVIQVHTTQGTQISRTVDASAGAVHPGETIVVQGTKNGDGSIDATVVRSNATAAGALSGLTGAGGAGSAGLPGPTGAGGG